MTRPATRKYAHLKTQEDAFVHFMQQLDIDMIDAILDAEKTYQDFSKGIFIRSLATALDEFRCFGDTKLRSTPGECAGCEKGCKGISFIGNKSRNYLDLIIKTEEGNIEDIFECAEFKNSDDTLKKKRRIYIDRHMATG